MPRDCGGQSTALFRTACAAVEESAGIALLSEDQDIQTLWFLLIAVAGGALLHVLTRSTVLAPGRALQTKFAGLGTLAGKTQAEIASVVGQPNALSGLPGGRTLLQWQAPGYHIALRFDGDVCEGITHQSVAR